MDEFILSISSIIMVLALLIGTKFSGISFDNLVARLPTDDDKNRLRKIEKDISKLCGAIMVLCAIIFFACVI